MAHSQDPAQAPTTANGQAPDQVAPAIDQAPAIDADEFLRQLAEAGPLPAAQTYSEVAKARLKLRYSHDAIIDQIIANPQLKQEQLAAMFGYSGGWVSIVMNSDAFRARLAQRRAEIIDPSLVATIEERFKGLVHQSLCVLADKLAQPNVKAEVALRALELGAKGLGLGGNAPPPAAPPVQDRLLVLAGRLTALNPRSNNSMEVIDVTAIEVPYQAPVGSSSHPQPQAADQNEGPTFRDDGRKAA